MQKSNAPTKLTVAFASGTGAGPVNTVPLTPGATPGTASYQTGFTSVNMEPIASGGVPPFGADFNGLFKAATTAQIWQQSGYMWPFDSTFAGNANIGGYPAGSVLLMGAGKGLWINQTDNNSQNPDAAGAAGWIGLPAAGTYTINTTGGTTTPDPSTLGVTTLLVAGALTSNATIVLPLSAGARWIIANNTSGSYTLTVQGATGSGVSITQGSALTVFTDGTNYYAASANISGQYLPINGTAVAATKLATARAFNITGLAEAAAVNFDGTGNVTFNVTALNVAGALGYTPANDAAVVHLANAETITGAKTFSATPIFSGGTIQVGSPSGIYITFDFLGAFSAAISAPGVTSSKSIQSTAPWGGVGAAPNTMAINASGSYGGGIGMTDGSYGIGLYSYDGTLNFGLGSNTSITAKATLDTNGNFAANGALTCTTMNATSSDRRLKRNIRKAEPRPLHRSTRFVSYTLKENGWNGLGAIAQEVRKIAPEHVGEFDQNGEKYLSLNYAGMAYEQATWASQEVDRLTLRLAKLERDLSRAKIAPRKRGFARRLLEAIW